MLHEERSQLSEKTIDLKRAIDSLREEFVAVPFRGGTRSPDVFVLCVYAHDIHPRALDFPWMEWLGFIVKLKTRSSVSSRAKARNGRRVSSKRLPSFAEAAKRVAGMMEGTPDLSSREGFGSKVLG